MKQMQVFEVKPLVCQMAHEIAAQVREHPLACLNLAVEETLLDIQIVRGDGAPARDGLERSQLLNALRNLVSAELET